jgi:hypothetical protein
MECGVQNTFGKLVYSFRILLTYPIGVKNNSKLFVFLSKGIKIKYAKLWICLLCCMDSQLLSLTLKKEHRSRVSRIGCWGDREDGECCIMRSFIVCTLHRVLLGSSNLGKRDVRGCSIGQDRTLVNMTINIRFPCRVENFLTSWAALSFWRTVIHGVGSEVQFEATCTRWDAYL